MKNKQKNKAANPEPQKTHLSLMAVQEKLGLFKSKQKPQDDDYLKNKPLGLI